MMRLLLCIGDEPETRGFIDPASGGSFSIRGHRVALIGASVHCNACNKTGPIVKAGGSRRSWYRGVEVAHDGDIVLCKCAKPPRMISTMQNTSTNDDMIESRGKVDDYRAGPAYLGDGAGHFDQAFTLKDRYTGQPLAGVRYRVQSASGVIHSGITDRTNSAHTRGMRGKNNNPNSTLRGAYAGWNLDRSRDGHHEPHA
ncbi:PAAR domain-containing protein [Caballeronia sp. dw_276]|uniref:PAAR domain-containing protein n=1 Tax=Caballeronia sp. dw_276 TaxID=2719795 RepID=UPI001BD6AF6E|nr:PAAR domain-containing protein [Caballeronia sp. dw_276]